MAIQVNGTTVIDNSRNLSNVGGLKTVNSTSLLGSGNIATGASTTLGAVGTYILARDTSSTTVNEVYKSGRTTAASNLESMAYTGGTAALQRIATSTSYTAQGGNQDTSRSGTSYVTDNQTYSGSWRAMSAGGTQGQTSSSDWNFQFGGLWVRYA